MGQKQEAHLSGGGRQAGSSSQPASQRTFPTGIGAEGSLGDPAVWALFHSMRQAPEISVCQYEFLYILSLGKKSLGHLRVNSGAEISLEKKSPPTIYFCLFSFLNVCSTSTPSFSV